jgi:hypothetical protein
MQTYKRVICAIAIALYAAPIAAMAADPRLCELFSTKEIASVLGATSGPGRPGDPDVAATAWACTWSADGRYFIAWVTRSRSAADAMRELTYVMESIMAYHERLEPSEVPGPGEQNLWGSSSKHGGIWVSRKGQTVLGVTAFDMDKMLRRESLREPLRDLVALGLKRLP